MATQTDSRCVLCQNPLHNSHPAAVPAKAVPIRASKCSVFVNKCDSLITELWVWIGLTNESPLEGLCGLVIDDVPHRAISETFEGALKITPFLKAAANQTGEHFKLVRFVQEKTVAQI